MSLLDLKPLTDEEMASITPHERAVMSLLETLNGSLHGFPDHERKLYNVARAWAEFMSLVPYKVKPNPYLDSPEDQAAFLAQFRWKEGVIPGEWLIERIRKSCEFLPAPIVAREIYAEQFTPADGIWPEQLSNAGRRRSADYE